ncbi:MAG: hypothetical protein LC637_00475, partial [Xanthomonadaceae bacterium]|nr:hypothetical protein [Xanthomonadaceae bacterium]
AILYAFGSGFSGNPNFIENLGDLIQRGGGRVERLRTGDTCTGSVVCTDAGADGAGNPVIDCRLVLPDVALTGC